MSTPHHEHAAHPGMQGEGHAHARKATHGPAPEHDRHGGVDTDARRDPAHGGHGGQGPHAGHGMSHTGHGGHGDHIGQFRQLFWIMLVLAVPTVLLSPMFAMIVGYDLPDVAGLSWVSPVLGTVIYVWGGRPFLTGAVSELKARKPGMMLLIGMAITVAFLASWAPRSACCPTSSSSGGARPPGRDHAARSLDRDALPRPDLLRAGLPRRAPARRGGEGRR
ncbi:hypothetical protein ACR6C2_27045 [Streptomyces sp. INA 01156]